MFESTAKPVCLLFVLFVVSWHLDTLCGGCTVAVCHDLEACCCVHVEIAQDFQNVVHVDRPALVQVVGRPALAERAKYGKNIIDADSSAAIKVACANGGTKGLCRPIDRQAHEASRRCRLVMAKLKADADANAWVIGIGTAVGFCSRGKGRKLSPRKVVTQASGYRDGHAQTHQHRSQYH